jgi:hypothetical protein
MVQTFLLGLMMLNAASVVAQAFRSDRDFIDSRQLEVAELGKLYGIDLSQGKWKHEQSPICPAFSHHIFATYDRDSAPGLTTSFVAIYSRYSKSGRDKPWQTGTILVPLNGTASLDGGTLAERASVIAAFNLIWSDELKASDHPNNFAELTWPDLAACYLRLIGERPQDTSNSAAHPGQVIDLARNRSSNVLINIVESGSISKSLSTEFDRHGMLMHAKIVEFRSRYF